MNRSFWRSGHTPTLLASFLYFDLSFMVWYLLGPLQVPIAQDLGLDTQQRAFMVAVPILCGAVLRLFLGMAADRIGAKRVGVLAQLAVIVTLLAARPRGRQPRPAGGRAAGRCRPARAHGRCAIMATPPAAWLPAAVPG